MSTKPTKQGKPPKKKKQRSKRDELVDKASWTYANKTQRAVPSTTNAYRADLVLTDEEEQALTLIGSCLFDLRLKDWKECKKTEGKDIAARKKALSPYCGDRYAYAICQLNNQQYQLVKRNIKTDIKLRENEQKVFDEREKTAAKWLKRHPDVVDENGKKPTKKEYNPLCYDDYNRRNANDARLKQYKANGGFHDITFGGKANHRRLMRAISKNGPDANRDRIEAFKKSRYNIKAIGDSTHKFGNSVVRIDDTWHVSIRVPDELKDNFAEIMGLTLKEKETPVLRIEAPVVFKYDKGAKEIHDNIINNRSITNDITFKDDKWIISSVVNSNSDTNVINSDAAKNGGSVQLKDGGSSFVSGNDNPAVVARFAVREANAAMKRDTVRSNFDNADCAHSVRGEFAARRARFAGVDVNFEHVDVAICDVYGNLVGKPYTVSYKAYRTSKQNKSSVLHALDRVRRICERYHVGCVFFEDLRGFDNARSRTLNDGGRGFRRIVSSIPSGEIKDWAARKLTSECCHVEFVSPAYTSQAAKAFWCGAIESGKDDDGGAESGVSVDGLVDFSVFSGVHQAAALMVARRGLGLGLYRRFGNDPVSSCVMSPVCCLDRREGSADGFGAGGVREGAVVPGLGRSLRRSNLSGAASDYELESSGEAPVRVPAVRRHVRRVCPRR